MKSRDVVGRTIVRVLQERDTNSAGETVYNVSGFVLDNGTVIALDVAETPEGSHYIIEADVVRATGTRSLVSYARPVSRCAVWAAARDEFGPSAVLRVEPADPDGWWVTTRTEAGTLETYLARPPSPGYERLRWERAARP